MTLPEPGSPDTFRKTERALGKLGPDEALVRHYLFPSGPPSLARR